MSGISRREFFKRSLASGVAGGLILSGVGKIAEASVPTNGPVGSMIDLSLCDGCRGLPVPRCVSACREENKHKYPQPVPAEEIHYYWPNKKKEDWQDKKDLTDRLTPYNWTFVQNVEVEEKGRKYQLSIPRRCMHCDNPPCANLCPFGAQYKTPEGPVLINKDLCLGGAKCRDVCPWGIPARQAGVGLYMKIAPKYLGAGVMYKCDYCHHRLKAGKTAACAEACPKQAIVFGNKSSMKQLAEKRAGEINGYVYGSHENGGTSTFYVSPVPFEKINTALLKQKSAQPDPNQPGFPLMKVGVENYTDSANGTVAAMLVSPVAATAAAGYAAYKTMKGGD